MGTKVTTLDYEMGAIETTLYYGKGAIVTANIMGWELK